MPISRGNITEYVFWDEINKRYDLTPKAFNEQGDQDVRDVLECVLRSWFIPQLTAEIKSWFEKKLEQKNKQLSLF